MKNAPIFITMGIMLITAAVLTAVPRNAVAQADTMDYTITEEEIQDKNRRLQGKASKICCYS